MAVPMKLESGSVVLTPAEVERLHLIVNRWDDDPSPGSLSGVQALVDLADNVRALLAEAVGDYRKPVVR